MIVLVLRRISVSVVVYLFVMNIYADEICNFTEYKCKKRETISLTLPYGDDVKDSIGMIYHIGDNGFEYSVYNVGPFGSGEIFMQNLNIIARHQLLQRFQLKFGYGIVKWGQNTYFSNIV